MTIVILFRLENAVRAGLICRPIDQQLLQPFMRMSYENRKKK